MTRRRVLVLGSTGSIGTQALEVLSHLTDTHQVVGISACQSSDLLTEQAVRFTPEAICLVQGNAPSMPPDIQQFSGPQGLVELVEKIQADLVICAITGAAGLPSTLAAAASGAIVALANKESMVMAGHLVKKACAASGSRIVPVDSEHCAIAQALEGKDMAATRRLILTASGGPFRGKSREDLGQVTPEQALAHPSWDMGPRISIDSATLMNKALEVIEACRLFDVHPDRVSVVIHPQSIIHSMVEFIDGSILAQMGPPDMRVPIRYALGFPERIQGGAEQVDLLSLPPFHFESPDRETFPCLAIGESVARSGELAATVMNAANEIAVDAFLAGRLPFLEISNLIDDALQHHGDAHDPGLDLILETDRQVRLFAQSKITQTTTEKPHA